MSPRAVIGILRMTSDLTPSPRRGARILNFRRRQPAPHPLRHPPSHGGSAPGLSQYERDNTPEDDYRHRMIVNLAAFLFVLVLVCVGYWLADTMARMRKDQDCVLSGRRGCSPVSVDSPRNRW